MIVELSLETIGDPGIVTANVSGQSSFELSPQSPYPLSLERGEQSMQGRFLRIPLRVRAQSSEPTSTVTVSAAALTPGVRIIEPDQPTEIGRVEPVVEFALVVGLANDIEAGRVQVVARGEDLNELVAAEFDVKRKHDSGAPSPRAAVLGVVLVGVGLAIVLLNRDRRPSN